MASTLNQYDTTPTPYTNTAATPAFLPQTPGYAAGLKNLTDQYHSTLANIGAQRAGLGSAYNQQFARMGTDVQLGRRGLNNAMAGRNMYNSSARQVLDREQIQTPYSRSLQDMNQQMDSAYGQLSQAEQSALLGYNQGLTDLLLQRAADAANSMPYGLPQYGSGDRSYEGYDYWYNPENVTSSNTSNTTTRTGRTPRQIAQRRKRIQANRAARRAAN